MFSLATTTAQHAGGGVRVIDMRPGKVIAPTIINPYTALTIPAYRRAVSFIADNLASFPPSVIKNRMRLPTGERHPLTRLLTRAPNAGQVNPFVFWRTWFYHAAHGGNGYAEIVRSGPAAAAVALVTMLPEEITPFRYWREGAGAVPEQWYLHRPSMRPIPAADVLHLQTLSHDGIAGLDPVTLHERTLQGATTLETYKTEYLQNGTVLRGAVEVPGDMDDDQIAQMRGIMHRFRGPEQSDDVVILTNGAKFNNVTTNAQQSQLAEQTAATTKAIAQITGVPPEFLFELSEAKYNNSVEQAGQNVVRYCLRPWIENAEAELTAKLIGDDDAEQGYSVNIEPAALLRGDTATQAKAAAELQNAGITTPNESRESVGMEPSTSPGADELRPAASPAIAGGRQLASSSA